MSSIKNWNTDHRPTLHAWLHEYDKIEQEFIASLRAAGVKVEPDNQENTQHIADLKKRLRSEGALFLNGGQSISHGFISSACRSCVGDDGSRTFYINLRCNKNCFYCFNQNQTDYERHRAHNAPWRKQLAELKETCPHVTHIGLTGGEPLLCKNETIAFFEQAHKDNPDAHLRLYTSGSLFDEDCAKKLAERGVHEIRFSIKLEEDECDISETIDRIALATRHIPDVMVEMPVIPGTQARMKALLRELDAIGISGINLLEFCFPFHNWHEFEHRGFSIKNPPFETLYDYGYAGGLPIAGSERDCLELLLFAMKEELRLGVHYCSVANKNIEQIRHANSNANYDDSIYQVDEDTQFIKAAKVFDEDVESVKRMLVKRNCRFLIEDEGLCLAFHPSLADCAASLGAVVAISHNVFEQDQDAGYLRELRLEILGLDHEEI